MKIFLTGSAGFIGFHLARRLLAEEHDVLGYDGLTPYYDVRLKRQRLALLSELPGFSFVEGMLQDGAGLARALRGFAPDIVVHLAAQAGVRDTNPDAYLTSNVIGTTNVLEGILSHPPRHFLHASTSSIYGANPDMPFSETSRTDFPVSLYAATKKACEAITHAYSHLYRLPITCFRFFTVYGPWGRPDMALFRFAEAITEGRPIDVYGSGLMKRDFTYIDDLIEAVRRLIDTVPQAGSPTQVSGVEDSLSPVAPWRTVNIAQGQPVDLLRFIEVLELRLGRSAVKNMLPMQPGDVEATWASPELLRALTDYVPETSIEVGVGRFIDWYSDWRTSRPS
jgi:UDP-glucuronate 4-epimerase